MRLAKLANDKNLWTDDPSTEPYKYGRGDGSTTMVLPDFRNRVIQGGDITAVKSPGLPNITGILDTGGNTALFYAKRISGAFSNNSSTTLNYGAPSGSVNTSDRSYSVSLNAANSSTIYGKSSTVQPPAICLIPQIKF